ncbi:MerR family DNA-binding transcriptional regulator, partial [Ligilactobacillus animalis]
MTMLKPKEMAERLGVTVRTLQIWDSKGVLKAYRTLI